MEKDPPLFEEAASYRCTARDGAAAGACARGRFALHGQSTKPDSAIAGTVFRSAVLPALRTSAAFHAFLVITFRAAAVLPTLALHAFATVALTLGLAALAALVGLIPLTAILSLSLALALSTLVPVLFSHHISPQLLRTTCPQADCGRNASGCSSVNCCNSGKPCLSLDCLALT
jgi:hypothetical protein